MLKKLVVRTWQCDNKQCVPQTRQKLKPSLTRYFVPTRHYYDIPAVSALVSHSENDRRIQQTFGGGGRLDNQRDTVDDDISNRVIFLNNALTVRPRVYSTRGQSETRSNGAPTECPWSPPPKVSARAR